MPPEKSKVERYEIVSRKKLGMLQISPNLTHQFIHQ